MQKIYNMDKFKTLNFISHKWRFMLDKISIDTLDKDFTTFSGGFEAEIDTGLF